MHLVITLTRLNMKIMAKALWDISEAFFFAFRLRFVALVHGKIYRYYYIEVLLTAGVIGQVKVLS